MTNKSKSSSTNSSDKVLLTFDIDNDTYFDMLKYCSENRISIDDFVEMALRQYIKKYKKDKKKKK